MWSTIGYAFSYVQQQLQFFYYGDDRPVVLEEGRNIWPPHLYLHDIALALNDRLPDEENRSRKVAFLDYGASHVVVVVETALGKTYVVRITSAVFDEFQQRHRFWPEQKEKSEVASMIALLKWTDLPVPRVYAFDDGKDNRIGAAWTLQEYVTGRPLIQIASQLSPEATRDAFKQIANYMLQLFEVQVPLIGSLEINGSLNGIRNLSESDLDIRVGRMVTLKGLRNPHLIDPPKDFGPFDDIREWLKSVAQGSMNYPRLEEEPIDQTYIDRVKQIIDEIPESVLNGPLGVNGFYCRDMWSLHNILALVEDGKVVKLHFVDFEGMQCLPAFVRAQAPFIPDIPDDWLKVLHDFLLEHPGFRHAHEEGLKYRHLLNLAERAWLPDPGDQRIKDFLEGAFGDQAPLSG
ncbi:hypothetical protein DACRYDRAFT_96159 [Dacryopinax primogenitus]|uniref:Aminoglycoside phosphotransferase domain-containing protein n=1 Tax=Dacryopinax primogenitus (strain DJM 731) TaxID=1858805 RepID=M5G0L9_DACPD|nr:uncharacterized protein DACRYDRAFT_96159 [Dacryopinax primogenitus]EJT99376.1 hypothetical protein DACRYDRAFT_96159 [Dacryopinax primogenitus]